jgi:hypothetical protein
LFIVDQIIVTVFLILASNTDPGIIPSRTWKSNEIYPKYKNAHVIKSHSNFIA